METVGYCLRVQAQEGYGDKVGALTLNPEYTAVLAVKHKGKNGENPHYHVVIRTGVKAQAFRVRMKKLFPDGKGNQHMSIVQWDGDNKALSYLFHEDANTPLIARKGLTDEHLHTIRQLNLETQELVALAKTKASHTLEEDVYQQLKGKETNLEDWQIGQLLFLTALRNNKYPPQTWLVRAMVIRIRFRLANGDLRREEKLTEALAKDIFCRYD